jgi:hypothetical protein
MEQMALQLFSPKERPTVCIHREIWHGYPYCYLYQTFRLPCGKKACEEMARWRKDYEH